MNEEKFTKKVKRKYGVKEDELANLSIARIRNLKVNEMKIS